ncbi:MAG: glycosyltransferase family 4 protein [Desulfobacterales bacterium]|nr:glycosyltransferase family 4 protein [Desulfobacterales bacterium]
MKISWFSHYFIPEIGAPSSRLYDLSKSWIKQDNEVHVSTCFPNHPKGKLYPGYHLCRYLRETINGIHVHRHWTYITPNKGIIKKTMGHLSFLLSSAIWNKKFYQDADVIIGTSPTPFAAMSASIAAKHFGKPFVMEVRDLWPAIFVELGVLKNPLLIKMLERFENYLYQQASRIITVTDSFRESIISKGISPSKVTTITNGADTDYWQKNKVTAAEEFKRQLGLEGKFIVLYIGAHGISHALSKILASASLLKKERNIHFLFVGDGAEKEMLLTKAKEENIQNVTFLEPTNKEGVRKFYAIADVCLVPLRDIPLFETFIPSKMFEIMAMECPIVASLKGEAANILRRSGSAIVVSPEDSHEIRDAIVFLFNNKEKRMEMGKKGRQFVSRYYSRNSLANSYLQTLKETAREYHSK